MILYLLKVLISALVIVAVSELTKRGGTFWGGVLASLPLTSLLALIWVYFETHDTAKIAALSSSIFWLVLPSLVFFIALPVLLARKVAFPSALAISLVLMIGAYLAVAALLKRFGILI